jgi:hypothetical protein
VALGTEGASWLYRHRVVQSAADNAAYSAAVTYVATSSDASARADAKAITANDYNLVDGVNGVTVTVNRPPLRTCYNGTSNYTGNNAIEVIVTEPTTPLFSQLWQSSNVNICGRGVAIIPANGDCVLSLATTGVGISTPKQNNLAINLTNCGIFANSNASDAINIDGNNNVIDAGSIGTVGGIALNGNSKSSLFNTSTGDPAVTDPYASAASSWATSPSPSLPTTCASCTAQNPPSCTNGKNAITSVTLAPGSYANALTSNLSKCSTVTMTSGTYLFSQGLSVPSSATLNIGAGSTIIIQTNGLTTGTVNFGGGANSINIESGGWTSNGSVSMPGSYSVYVQGGGSWTIDGSPSTIGSGTYYISGNLNITGSGGQTVTGSGVTLALTGATSAIDFTSNNATLTLTAPTASGWNQGIAIWEPNSTATNQIATGNSSIANITGVIYTPKAGVSYAGNTGSTPECTQIIASTISFGGNSINLTGNCSSVPGVKIFGQTPALVE